MLFAIGALSFMLGVALLFLAFLLMLFDCLFDFTEVLFKIAMTMIIIPIVAGLFILAFGALIGLFGFTLLF